MEPKINIGIPDAKRVEIAEGLSRLLADTYTLYLKTHNFHWNVTGPMFTSLHTLFETQYTEMWAAVDEIAERIRALDKFAPGSYSEFAKLSSIAEAKGVPSANEMLQELLAGHEAVVRTARTVIPVAQGSNDESTVDLLIGRMTVHEKTAWMIRSLLRD
jgi:starvation-inducible DNA-binding protein